MKFLFGSLLLSPGPFEDAVGLTINGQQVNDPVQFLRASEMKYFPRGNRSTQIGFNVTRNFDSYRAAQRFLHEQFSLLATQADLFVTLGITGDEETCLYANAVLESISLGVQSGLSVPVQYSFLAGIPTFSVSPPSYVEPDNTMIQRSASAIPNGDSSLAVTFTPAFGSTPVVVANVQIPSGGDFIFATVRDGTVSTTGFTADLSGATPAIGYKLSWIASA